MHRDDLERELNRLHGESFGWALNCCRRDRNMAEDVLHTAYLAVLSGTARFEERSTFRTWLFGVIRRTALAELRRARRWIGFDSSGQDVALVQDATPSAAERIEARERRGELLVALGRLSPRQREVLVLVFYHDLTIEEAARVMEVSLGSSRTHYDRGKKALAAALGPERHR